MKRYSGQVNMFEDQEEGDWVKFEDAQQDLVEATAQHDELQRKLAATVQALQSIAQSYPETDEGECLAGTARDALAEVKP